MNWDNYQWGTNIVLVNPGSGLEVIRNYNLVICQNPECNKPVLPRVLNNPRGLTAWIGSGVHNKKKFCCSKHKTNKHSNQPKNKGVTKIDPVSRFLSPGQKKQNIEYMRP